jgi:hypothetical protein
LKFNLKFPSAHFDGLRNCFPVYSFFLPSPCCSHQAAATAAAAAAAAAVAATSNVSFILSLSACLRVLIRHHKGCRTESKKSHFGICALNVNGGRGMHSKMKIPTLSNCPGNLATEPIVFSLQWNRMSGSSSRVTRCSEGKFVQIYLILVCRFALKLMRKLDNKTQLYIGERELC